MLKSKLLREYQQNGYIHISKLISRKFVQELQSEADGALERAVRGGRNASFMWGGKFMSPEERAKLALSGLHDMQFQSAAFSRLLLHAPMLDAVEALIGPNIQLHHTKLIVKPPENGAPSPMHQDCPYFPHRKHTMLAVMVHLDDTTEANGCLRMIPGSHRRGPLKVVGPKDLYLPPKRYPIEQATPVYAKAGDAVIFSYLTIHGSGLNTTERPRRTFLIQLRDPSDPPRTHVHESRGQGMMLRGQNPNILMPSW